MNIDEFKVDDVAWYVGSYKFDKVLCSESIRFIGKDWVHLTGGITLRKAEVLGKTKGEAIFTLRNWVDSL